jgi:hypothetical protein
MTNTEIKFTDGQTRLVNAKLAPKIIALDFDGDLCINFYGECVALTSCCNATGKGGTDVAPGESGIVCRACYRPVSSKYGTTVRSATYRVGL